MHHQIKKFMYERKVTVLRLRYSYEKNKAQHTFVSVAWKTLSLLSTFTVVFIKVNTAITVF